MYRRTCASCRSNARACMTAGCAADTVPAGQACSSAACAGFSGRPDAMDPLATIYFPIQEYTAGLCPDAALSAGTMFAELIK